jgi:hypothetical protein
MLNPGTSTIQTRARYFLFIPWIYQDVEAKAARSNLDVRAIDDRLRKSEIRLIDALAESDDSTGTIGIEARARLKRLPSNVYWRGLGTWGIRLFEGSQSQYHRGLATGRAPLADALSTATGDEARRQSSWHPAIPKPPDGYPKEASFALAYTEAEYLQDRILSRAPRTLLAFLVDRATQIEETNFPWEADLEGLPESITTQLGHARNFSETIFGAAILYNLQLARLVKSEELVETYEKEFSKWCALVEERRTDLESWDRAAFWRVATSHGAKIPAPTHQFVDVWLDMLFANKPEDLESNSAAQGLIEQREAYLKGDEQARLVSPKAREIWRGASGAFQLDYRWWVTRAILNDIAAGFEKGASHA